MNKRRWLFTFPLVLLVVVYFSGPRPARPQYSTGMPAVPSDPVALEQYIDSKEKRHILKTDNQARIVWHDSSHQKTPFAVVYLHGFSASYREGDPVHRRFASAFGCNLYLPRLSDHGVDTTEALLLFTADRLWNSAKEALAIGNQLGEKVVLISTSTGGTLALMLAATYPERVHGLINLSPNIEINNSASFLLNNPWGLYIARLVMGGKYRITGVTPEKATYWNGKYRLESVVQLQELLESSMHEETFRKVTQPALTLYYYKNEEEQDPEVRVSAMLDMHRQLGTPDSLKVIRPMPMAGAHVLGSDLSSHDVDGVYREMESFALRKLGLVK